MHWSHNTFKRLSNPLVEVRNGRSPENIAAPFCLIIIINRDPVKRTAAKPTPRSSNHNVQSTYPLHSIHTSLQILFLCTVHHLSADFGAMASILVDSELPLPARCVDIRGRGRLIVHRYLLVNPQGNPHRLELPEFARSKSLEGPFVTLRQDDSESSYISQRSVSAIRKILHNNYLQSVENNCLVLLFLGLFYIVWPLLST